MEKEIDITDYDCSGLPEDKKLELIKGFTETTAKHALQLFMALGLKTHIDTIIVNEATKEEFILSFRRVGSGLPLASPLELEHANKRIKELDDMYLKLSQKYADLYEKRK
jgi:hypothetical protein